MGERTPLRFLASDLAPGDAKSAALDSPTFNVVHIDRPDHPLFGDVYNLLWREFAAKHELEPCDVLVRRFAWHPARPHEGCALLYDLLAVLRGGEIVGVRDHTAIVPLDAPKPHAVVHLSHVLVVPEFRRSGLAGWLRALPIQTARECLRLAGWPASVPIALAAEMDHPRADAPDTLIRLRAYEKAGFRKFDPELVPYLQPDFRPAHVIDSSGGPRPLPFALTVRRVGREQEHAVPAAEARAVAGALYRMYGATFRREDMAPVCENLNRFPPSGETVRLLPPTVGAPQSAHVAR